MAGMHKLASILLLCLAAAAAAEPTPVHVRVLSQGAKFVGSSMGGVEIVIRDAETRAILARGTVMGSTGDTGRIMGGGPRDHVRHTADSAVFRASLDLPEPRLLEVSARGPLAQAQSAVTVTSQMWVIPGRGVTAGDGWLLELPGLVTDVVEPAAHQQLPPGTKRQRIAVDVAMMCGCPITPGGMWDSARFEVVAHVRRGDGPVIRLPLSYAGRTGHFAAELPLAGAGAHVVTVTAHDLKTGASGVDRTSFILP